MKPKLILCLSLVLSGGLFGYSNIARAQDKPDWSPIEMTSEVAGTFAVPPEYRQKLNLPERIAFDIKIDSAAERISNTDRSQANINYLVVLKNTSTNLVYLDWTNAVSGDVNGTPQQAVERIRKPAIDNLTDTLKKFIGQSGNAYLTNTMTLSNLSTNTSAMSTNDIVIEKLKLEENGDKIFDYPKSP